MRLGIIRYKRPRPPATSEVSGAEAGNCTWCLHTAPPRRCTDSLSQQSAPPLSHLESRPALLREWARAPVPCIHSLVLQQTKIPIKPSLHSSCGTVSISVDEQVQGPESYQLHSIISLLSFNLNFTNTYMFTAHCLFSYFGFWSWFFPRFLKEGSGTLFCNKDRDRYYRFLFLPQGSRIVQPQTVTNSAFI